MYILKFRVRGQALTLINPNIKLIPVTDTVNQYLCQFEFSEDWDDLNKVVVFKNVSYNISKEVYLSTSNECYIPWEVLSNSGEIFLEVIGTEVRGEVVTVRIPSTLLGFKWQIQEGLLDVSANISPTPDLFEQFVSSVRSDSIVAATARDEAVIARDVAVQSAADASASELAATSAAESAVNSASTASSAASSASEAALSVAGIADETRSYAEIASTKAAEAATEAELAAGAKEDAVMAKNDAEAARDAAVVAKNDAETARDATLSAKETFDNNAETKLTAYNHNALEKTASYNTNATEKLNAYNANADNRVAEFNAQTEQIQADVSELKSDLTELENECLSVNVNVNPTLVDGKFINATNNNIANNSQFSLTEPIPVKKGQLVKLTATGYSNVVGMIATCNADNSSRQVVSASIGGNEYDYTYKVKEDGYVVCSFANDKPYKLLLIIDYYSLYNSIDTLIPINKGTESESIVVLSTGFINATNNKYVSSNNYNLSESIILYKGQTVNLTATGYNTVVGMINLYDDDNDTYETVVPSIDSLSHTYTYTATKDCFVRFSYDKNKPASATITTDENRFVRISNIENTIADLQDRENYPVEYPMMFTNVICIGDSLTYGHNGQTRLTENYPFYFAKLADVTISNQGLSGSTTKQWWDELGNSFNHFADYDCAIIYLGTNGGLTDTVSTDCNASDYTQNADTNTGCYGKIIGKIKADAPNCKIFCVAGPSEYLNRDSNMNPAVRHLAEFYDVGLIDLSGCMMDDNGTTASVERYRYRPYDGIHYNKLGYFTFANMIYDYMNKYIENHLSKYVS